MLANTRKVGAGPQALWGNAYGQCTVRTRLQPQLPERCMMQTCKSGVVEALHRGHATPWARASLKTYIVEDNVTIRENLVGTLEELTSISAIGFAETEAEAVRWLCDNGGEWELAIVDLFLKQGSGLGVLQACISRRPNQKVVVLSNYATPDIRRRCAQFGVDAVFDKSNEIDALIDFCIEQSSAGEEDRAQ